MSNDTIVILPPQANSPRIFAVINRALGAAFIQNVDSYRAIRNKDIITEQDLDMDKPSSAKNPWLMEVKKDYEVRLELSDVSYHTYRLKDVAGQSHKMFLFLEEEGTLDPGWKQILADNCAVSAALGKKLVDFFGGLMCYNTNGDQNNQDNWYKCSQPQFEQWHAGSNKDERWYRFNNLLFNTSTLTAKDLLEVKDKVNWTPTDEALCSYLLKLDEKNSLQEKLEVNPSSAAARKKL